VGYGGSNSLAVFSTFAAGIKDDAEMSYTNSIFNIDFLGFSVRNGFYGAVWVHGIFGFLR
jgi:hypothetical protein